MQAYFASLPASALEVTVKQEDFITAAHRARPSVTEADLQSYEALRTKIQQQSVTSAVNK